LARCTVQKSGVPPRNMCGPIERPQDRSAADCPFNCSNALPIDVLRTGKLLRTSGILTTLIPPPATTPRRQRLGRSPSGPGAHQRCLSRARAGSVHRPAWTKTDRIPSFSAPWAWISGEGGPRAAADCPAERRARIVAPADPGPWPPGGRPAVKTCSRTAVKSRQTCGPVAVSGSLQSPPPRNG